MDVTFRKIDGNSFRKFKARCAELGISMGDGFNEAVSSWMGEKIISTHIPARQKQDIHTLTDLGSHIHMLSQNKEFGGIGKVFKKTKEAKRRR
ncbi:hypothetical protein HY989_04985 [Candidatus Micrarchaeota archaeon]|nr:hypothetical protein [Candidatus Micrarchaeota archaeon]